MPNEAAIANLIAGRREAEAAILGRLDAEAAEDAATAAQRALRRAQEAQGRKDAEALMTALGGEWPADLLPVESAAVTEMAEDDAPAAMTEASDEGSAEVEGA